MLPTLPPTREPLRVASIGYFNRFNYGDELLQQSIARLFMHHAINFLGWMPSYHALNESDLVLVGGGSIWPDSAFFTRHETLFAHLNVPFCVIGISARGDSPEIRNRTKRLVDRATFFHVRDQETLEVLPQKPGIRAGADLSWWNDDIPQYPALNDGLGPIALNLREWKRTDWSPTKLVEACRETGSQVLPMPMFFGSPVHDSAIEHNDTMLLEELGLPDPRPYWRDEVLSAAAIVVSMRFHGLLLGIRSCRPVIGFDYHPKIRSLFASLGMSEFCLPLNEPAKLTEAIEKIRDDYDNVVARVSAIRNALFETGQADRNAFLEALKQRFSDRF
ncbi:polysaccharide pyruvyl transferase family protein [Chitinimonas sp. PSY-7]|uniref:polysaccharide pyruvyl transferase family protein n=1 Tax=Chitinimonas sp. PSY-7 TaxID=3459088 RepID=UPI0040403656